MAANREQVHIHDLHRPVMTMEHRAQLSHWERNPVELTEQAVLRAASLKTGLNDFGPTDFRARMRNWLFGAANESNRTALGRAMVFQMCERYATTRLLLQALLQRHPEILKLEIRRPIIVVGPGRSGTTHLVNLLATDTRLRALPYWESREPIPSSPGEGRQSDHVDARAIRCDNECRRMRALLPHLSAMHPVDSNHICEEIELQGPNFSGIRLESLTPLMPDVRRWRERDDHARHYEYMRTMLKALQWQGGPDTWVLKSPHHAMYLEQLMAAFPGATVVMTHRDPITVLSSSVTMRAYMARLEYHEIDLAAILTYWIEYISSTLHAGMLDRQGVPHNRIVDVMFSELVDDGIGVVQKIYAAADLELAEDQRRQMENYLESHGESAARVAHDLRDFGVEASDVRERFAHYYDAFSGREV